MKNFLLTIALIISASFMRSSWALEPWQGRDLPVEDWRCGAPLIEALKVSDPNGLLQNAPARGQLKETLEAISLANLKRRRNELGALSEDEKDLIELIKNRFPIPIVHRTSVDVSKLLLTGKIDLSSPVKRDAAPRYTPSIEQQIFAGWDCIFASAAPPFGITDYGIVIARLKNKSNFSWGSIYTGFSFTREVFRRSIYDPATLEMKVEFSKQIHTNNHYNEAVALQIIKNIRSGDSIRGLGASYNKRKILKTLLSYDDSDDFWSKISRHRLGFFEAHYTDDVTLQDFEFIQFRSMDMPIVNGWGLPQTWFNGPYRGFVRHFPRDQK